MPEIESYTFNHKELIELLVKAAGVTAGEWQLQVTFAFSAGNFGQDDDSLSPGAIAIVTSLGIAKAKPDSPRALVIDAAKINAR